MPEPEYKPDSNEPMHAPEGFSWLVFRLTNRFAAWKLIIGMCAVLGLVIVLPAWLIWHLDWTQDVLYGCNGGPFSAPASRAGQLAFVSDRDGTPQIYLINADGTGLKRLTSNRDGGLDPAWSPDGRQIAFTSRRDGNADIYVMNADGFGQKRLTFYPSEESAPSWSPDGGRIAFQSGPNQLTAQIFVLRADGSAPARLELAGREGWTPDWSPDGSRIVFSRVRASSRGLWVMKSDGADPSSVSRNAHGDWDPQWSPDGQRIAFHSSRDGAYEIYSMRPDGTNVKRLTDLPSAAYDPAWSSDGSRIAFTYQGPKNRQICLMNADGTGLTAITRGPADDWAPAWRPDGSSVHVALAASATPAATATLYPNPWRATSPPAIASSPTRTAATASPTRASATPTFTHQPEVPPTATGTLRTIGNLARNMSTSSSRSESARPAYLAVDGNGTTDWGSGAFPPQWIQIDLGAPASVVEILMQVTQYPGGYTEHRILVGATPEDLHEVHRFQQQTRSGQWLDFTPETPLEDVRFVRVLTTVSPSWVGWVEIVVSGYR